VSYVLSGSLDLVFPRAGRRLHGLNLQFVHNLFNIRHTFRQRSEIVNPGQIVHVACQCQNAICSCVFDVIHSFADQDASKFFSIAVSRLASTDFASTSNPAGLTPISFAMTSELGSVSCNVFRSLFVCIRLHVAGKSYHALFPILGDLNVGETCLDE